MSRPIRIEFPNALYHVTSRGDRREAIFEDDDDRLLFLQTLGQVVEQFNWLCYAWCLMDNHYHLLIQTPDGKKETVLVEDIDARTVPTSAMPSVDKTLTHREMRDLIQYLATLK